MTFLPIVGRELRVRSRDKNTWRIRALAAAAAFLVGAPLLLLSRPGGSVTGLEFFYALTGLSAIFCVFEGARQTSDSISSERREGTLGLLFLTDLRGYDIVLGKLAVTSINSFFGLLAIFPILSVALLAGGITVGEFWRMSLALVMTLMFSLATGICISARNSDERRAILVTAIFLGVVIGGVPLLDNLFGFAARKQSVFSLLSPVSGCFMATDRAYTTGPHRFWLSQLATLLGAIGLLAFAAVTLTPITAAAKQPGPGLFRARRGQSKRAMVDVEPIPWLATANTSIPRVIIVLLLVDALVAIVRLHDVLSTPAAAGAGGVTVTSEIVLINVVVGLLAWFLVAYLASDFFLQLRRTGLLELLLCTPLSDAEIVRGHRRAMWRMLRWPTTLWLCVSIVGELPEWIQFSRSGQADLVAELVLAHAAELVGLVLGLLALTYAGAWFSLTSRRTAHALGKLLALVLVLPAIAAMIFSMFIGLSGISSIFLVQFAATAVMSLIHIFLIVWAGKRLNREFREAAVRQITGEPSAKPERKDEPATYFSLLGDPR